jgi:NAD(P)-dependent dehydrogenase (short-subunit alcohol dehydrogenase family)
MASSVDHLVLVGRSQTSLAALADELAPGAVPVRADVSDPADQQKILHAIEERRDNLAWLVIASGIPRRGLFGDLTEQSIVETYMVNLVGPTLLLRQFANLSWAPNASVVVIGSVSASRALPKRSVYAASKAGLEHLCSSLAVEWAPRGIRVNVVAPGVIATPFLGDDRSALNEWVLEHVPARRLGAPEEVAEIVRYVSLGAPDYLTGSRIAIDGGVEAKA